MTQEAQKTDLREKVAREIYAANMRGTSAHSIADAVLAIARPAIIEECAAFVETFDDEVMSFDIAHEMRKLAEKP